MPTHLHDPSICYLNHGAFGGTPKELLEEQHRLRLLMEAEPVDFLVRNNEARWHEAIAPVAQFLNAEWAAIFVHTPPRASMLCSSRSRGVRETRS